MTRSRKKVTRSALLFGAGLIGIGAETFYSLRYHTTPDSGLVVVFAAMLGLPAFLKMDIKGQNDQDDDSSPDAGKAKEGDRGDKPAPPTAR